MTVLVDYDNILDLDRTRGPLHVVNRIVDCLTAHLASENELVVRLYGGWFAGTTLSRSAQVLAPKLRAEFPRSYSVSVCGVSRTLRVRADLALALWSTPTKYLTHTYRERQLPRGIRCRPVPFSGCARPGACATAQIAALLRDSECPQPGCSVGVEAIFVKDEQKLVDTMLAVDLIHLASLAGENVAVVCGDDDLWPAIQAASAQSSGRILHLYPQPGRTTPTHYASLVGPNYSFGCF